MNHTTHDAYGFPLVYEKTTLARMQVKIDLPTEIIESIRRYFSAASNLYAKIPLRKLYEIYNSQNEPLSESDFLQVADLISHEQHDYAVLGREVFWEDEPPSGPMDRELVAEHLYAIGDEYYYETEMRQEGVQYYIPEKDVFLKYADENYIENTPQYTAMMRYLQNSQRDLRCPPAEIVADLHLAMTMGDDYGSMTDNARRLGVRFDSDRDFYTYLELLIDMCRHTRQFDRRGHTPVECNAPIEDIDLLAAGIQYEGEYEDGFTKTAKLLGSALDKPRSKTLSGTSSRNTPCPCGSGRKYKNCCGKRK